MLETLGLAERGIFEANLVSQELAVEECCHYE